MTAPIALEDVERAVSILKRGGVIAMPTDTLYALVATGRDSGAVERVFQIKGRGDNKPLPLFVKDVDMAERAGILNDDARRLASRFWPGPLTIVVPVREGFESLALAGGDTVALRVPDSEVALSVIVGVDEPLTATSANLSGGPDPVSADDVRHQLGDAVDFVIDGGPCPVAVSSTIVDCTRPEHSILRAGAVSEMEIIRTVLGPAKEA
jgi:L-threonylcarbamoyladenylate synthase